MSSENCYACTVLYATCSSACVFAPHFSSTNREEFARVCRTFGAENIYKILSNVDVSKRKKAVNALCYEAEARERDPVSGSYAMFLHYQDHLKVLDEQIEKARSELASIIGPNEMPPYSSLPMPDDFLTTPTSLISHSDGHGNAGASTSTSAIPSMNLGNTHAIRETLQPPQNQNQP